MEFKPFLISFLLVGLFGILLVNGGIQLATVNNANQSIADDSSISAYADSLNSTLSDVYGQYNSSESALATSPITLGTGTFVFDAITGIWKTLKVVPSTIYSLTVGLIGDNILGDGKFAVITGVIGAIIIVIIIFGVWKFVTTGDAG